MRSKGWADSSSVNRPFHAKPIRRSLVFLIFLVPGILVSLWNPTFNRDLQAQDKTPSPSQVSDKNRAGNTARYRIQDSNLTNAPYTNLNGVWDFYWMEWVESAKNHPAPIKQTVPSSWRNQEYYDQETNQKIVLPGFGFGTYRLELELPSKWKDRQLGLYIGDFGSAYRLFVESNGTRTLVSENGKLGINREEYLPDMRNRLVDLKWDGSRTLVFWVEVANFDNKDGGFWNPLLIGEREALSNYRESIRLRDIFFVGAMFIIGLYAVSFYALFGREKSALYFGLFCLIITARIGITGERVFLDFWQDLPFWATYRLEYLSFYLATPLFQAYLRALFPREYPRKLYRILLGLFTIFVLIVLATPMHVYTQTVHYYQALTLAFVIPAFYTLYRGLLRKKIEAYMIILSSMGMMLAVMNDILYHNNILKLAILVPYGFFQFTLVQTLILGRKFAIAFRRTDSYAKKYRRMNTKLETIVEERTSALNVKMEIIQKDMEMARLIQTRSIGIWFPPAEDKIRISYVYEPMVMIGGDFFDIYKKRDGSGYRIFLADATGHGIQGSLVAMSIRADYEYAKRRFSNVEELMFHLNISFYKKFRDLNVYYSAFIADIDPNTGTLTIQRAGHPDQTLVRRNGQWELLGSRGGIIGLTHNMVFHSHTTRIETGDRFYLFTDGFFEQFDSSHTMYGEDRLYQSILNNRNVELKASVQNIKMDLSKFVGNSELQDDIAMVAVELG